MQIRMIQNESTYKVVSCHKYEVMTWNNGAKELVIYEQSSRGGDSYTIKPDADGEINIHGNQVMCRAVVLDSGVVVDEIEPILK